MKFCRICKKDKPFADFSKKTASKDGLCSTCKKCSNNKSKEHYVKNKKRYKERSLRNNKRYVHRNREFVYQYLIAHPCIDCGENNPIKLDFDHLKDKKYNVSEMAQGPYSVELIKKEIEKCVIRCSNCHRLKTAKENNWWIYTRCKSV